MALIPHSSARCIELNENVAIILNYPHEVSLSGIVNVKVIRGTVQVLGYNLTPNKPAVSVYSIREFNTLKVIPVNDVNDESDTSYLKSLNITQNEIDRLVKESMCYSHFFIVSKSKDADNFVSFLRDFDFPPFIKWDTDDVMVRLSSTDGENSLAECSEWDDLATKFLRKPRKVIICGGKSVGKSTFLRYLINRHLAEWSEVLVVDFDPGQSEFTIMGCLSAVLVKQPLLGPNFSHITTPERSIYLGDVSVGTCPRLYSESVEKLVNFCDRSNFKEIPWIVNTMGFTKGLGITLLGQIMEAVKPTDIVQIMSGRDQNNFPAYLTPEFFNLQNLKRNENSRWKPKLHILPSMSEKNTDYGVSLREPVIKRNIVTMCYFRKALTSAEGDLYSVTPKRININRVQITITKPSSKEIEMTMTSIQKLCCVNANLVALCGAENMDEPDCLGFGIVRGFDIKTDCIHLITPLSEEILRRVTVIKMSSSIQLPQIFYKNHLDQINGSYPFFNYKISSDKLNQPIRKTSSRLR